MQITTRSQLLDRGVTDRQIAAWVAAGALERLRGGIYAGADVDPTVRAAVRAGGRFACASELRRLGVWVLDDREHAHFVDRTRFTGVRHWRRLVDAPMVAAVSPTDAMIQALDCLPRVSAVAALDSALHLGLVSRRRLDDLDLTRRARARISDSDPRAESGLETIARLMARDLGLSARPQVDFEGVGRVDLVVQDAVVVEADGDRFHSDAATRRNDRRRDALLAQCGYSVVRFGYDQLVSRPAEVAGAVIGALGAQRRVKDPGRIVALATNRARSRGWT